LLERIGRLASVGYRRVAAAAATLDAIRNRGGGLPQGPSGRSRSGPQESWMAAKSDDRGRVVAHNRKARFNYEIGETFEAGIALTGTEVKALRLGKATIAESYADARGSEIWLVNANIPEYLQAGRFNHAPKRIRKLLLHRGQINKLMGAVEREGMTLVPLKLYFNDKGRAKLELALEKAQLGARTRPPASSQGLIFPGPAAAGHPANARALRAILFPACRPMLTNT
jgi:SsrA-binding protein